MRGVRGLNRQSFPLFCPQNAHQIPNGHYLKEILEIHAHMQLFFSFLDEPREGARTEGKIKAQIHAQSDF